MKGIDKEMLIAAAACGLARPATAEIARRAGISEGVCRSVFIGRLASADARRRVREVLGLSGDGLPGSM